MRLELCRGGGGGRVLRLGALTGEDLEGCGPVLAQIEKVTFSSLLSRLLGSGLTGQLRADKNMVFPSRMSPAPFSPSPFPHPYPPTSPR